LDDLAADEAEERSESDWGLAEKKPGMGREAKIAVAVILLLLCGFGVAVAKKVRDKQQAALAEQEEHPETKSPGAGEPPPRDDLQTVPQRVAAAPSAQDDSSDPFASTTELSSNAEPAGPRSNTAAGQNAANANPFADAATDASASTPASDAEIVTLGEEPIEMEPAGAPRDVTFNPADTADSRKNPYNLTAAASAADEPPLEAASQSEPRLDEPQSEASLGEYTPVQETEAQAGSQTQVLQPGTKTALPPQHPARSGDADFHPGYRTEEIATEQARGSIHVARPGEGHGRVAELPPDAAHHSTGHRSAPQQSAPYQPVGQPHRSDSAPRRSPAHIDLDEFDPNAASTAAAPRHAHAEPLFEPQQPRHAEMHGQGHAQPLTAAHAAVGGDEYVIQPHDNYWIISRKRYGTIRYFMALEKHNAASVPDPRQLRPGMKVHTPPKEFLERTYPKLLPVTGPSQLAGYRGAAHSAEESNAPAGFFVSPTGEPMYRVGPQDTLTSISKDHLGRSSRWDEIFNLNRGTLPDANSLKIGTLLRLPNDASQHRLVTNPRENR
jgi:nucleoid-associated protein YgaU